MPTSKSTTPTSSERNRTAYDNAVTDWEKPALFRTDLNRGAHDEARRKGGSAHRRRVRHRPRHRPAAGLRGSGRRGRRRQRRDCIGRRWPTSKTPAARPSPCEPTSPRRRLPGHGRTPPKRRTASWTSCSTTPGISHAEDDDAVTTAEDVWDLTFSINVKSVFLGCKYGIPAMRRCRGRLDHQHRLVRRPPGGGHPATRLHRRRKEPCWR